MSQPSPAWVLIAPFLLVACAAGSDDPLGADGTGSSPGSGGTAGATGGDEFDDFELGSYAGAGPNWANGGDCTDVCPAPNGVQVACKKRFMYGVNYAWSSYGADFGGVSAWAASGVSRRPKVYVRELAEMRAAGASTVRWWIQPDFRGDGVEFDEAESPVGLGGSLEADLDAALQVAEAADVSLMLCLFSFDAFRYSRDASGAWAESLGPIVRDATKRAALLQNVVRPIARLVAAHPLAYRVVAWDVINEPEWAVTGPNPYGYEAFEANTGEFDAVSHAEMETFLQEAITVLHEESSAPVSVGFAAAKWATAWQNLDTDFHQYHIYDWVNEWWPYSLTPTELGLGDKPLVMGEFPVTGLDAASYSLLLTTWWQNGYAGALGWSFSDADYAFEDHAGDVKAFADAHACETDYSK